MAPKKSRLFEQSELGPRVDPKRARRRHLHAADDPSEQMLLNRDGTGLVPGLTDGLPVRLVKPHSAEKARTVRGDLGTVGRAMGNKWFKLHYLELYCGPGFLLDESTGEEVPGSPLQALGIQRPFDNYVFSDFSDTCVDALERRIAAVGLRDAGSGAEAVALLRGRLEGAGYSVEDAQVSDDPAPDGALSVQLDGGAKMTVYLYFSYADAATSEVQFDPVVRESPDQIAVQTEGTNVYVGTVQEPPKFSKQDFGKAIATAEGN